MINNLYLLALHNVNGLGPIRLKTLLDYFSDPKLAWEASKEDFINLNIPQSVFSNLVDIRSSLDLEKYAQEIKQSGIEWISIYDEQYPYLLKQIYDPPIIIYYKGDLKVLNQRCMGIVGSRRMTSYGRMVTEKFSASLCQAGLVIVSGLAFGVDSAAHHSAINNNGQTIAVLGGGLNHIFPTSNLALAQKIAAGFGAIISEYPPDAPSLPGNFPARNRIISGLSQAVLVTEADVDSGSLITARSALEQGRDVYAIPGPINSTLSQGPISLIKEGAKVVMDPAEILEDLGLNNSERVIVNFAELSKEEKAILDLLENESFHLDEISRSLNLPISKLSGLILKMEINGFIKSLGAGIYAKV